MGKNNICIVVPAPDVKSGIAAVVKGYRNSTIEQKYNVFYVESYCNGNKIIKLLKAIKGYFIFLYILLIKKPQLVHIHSAFGPSFYRKIPYIILAKLFKISIINHIHGSEFDKFFTNAGRKKQYLVKVIYGLCSKVIVLSEEWNRRLSVIIDKEKLAVIENYTTIQPFDINHKKNQILFLGLINQNKGCYDMPFIIKRICNKNIMNFKFIIGGVGDVAHVTELLKEFKIEDKVEFPGWVGGEKKTKLLQESKIFFLPSYTEAMPMSILEAMGYGDVIVSTNVGGIPDVIQSKLSGILCEPGDIEGFADAIINILKDDAYRKQLATQGYNIAVNRFSKDKHISLICHEYEKVYLSSKDFF